MDKPIYNFGILANGMYLYPWQKKVITHLLDTDMASCELFIIRKTEEKSSPKSALSKLLTPGLLFEQYKKAKLNTSIYRPLPFSLANEKTIFITPIQHGKFGEGFTEEDVERVKSVQLDFIIRFGFGILKGDILSAAKWGIWSFHHGDEQVLRGGPPGFWEIFKSHRKQGVILQRLTEKLDAGKIILKREYLVVPHSYKENVTKLLVESVDMPAQALRMISNSIVDPHSFEEVKTSAPIFKYPTNFQFLRFQWKVFMNRIRLKWKVLFKQENWILGYRTSPQEKYRYIAPKRGGEYYADPFVFVNNNKTYIVAEHYSYRTKKGSIVLIEPGMNQSTTLLEKNTHLAYPFIFHEGNEIYMLPEEAYTGKLHLYKWNGETKKFHLLQSILDLPAVDASLLKHEGKYYLFTGLKGQLTNEKLFIYYADKLEGPYLPHTSNPVKVSPEGSRMAGGFIIENNQLIRPSQCSVKYYGEKVVFQKIVQLSPTVYQEEFYSELKPMEYAPFKCGLHTYNKKDHFEVIDLKTMRSGFIALKAQI